MGLRLWVENGVYVRAGFASKLSYAISTDSKVLIRVQSEIFKVNQRACTIFGRGKRLGFVPQFLMYEVAQCFASK